MGDKRLRESAYHSAQPPAGHVGQKHHNDQCQNDTERATGSAGCMPTCHAGPVLPAYRIDHYENVQCGYMPHNTLQAGKSRVSSGIIWGLAAATLLIANQLVAEVATVQEQPCRCWTASTFLESRLAATLGGRPVLDLTSKTAELVQVRDTRP